MKNSHPEQTVYCQILKKLIPIDSAKPVLSIRQSVIAYIREKYPDLSEDGYISETELNIFKAEHIKSLLEGEQGQLTEIQKQVAETVAKHDFMSKDFTEEEEDTMTFGERLSDKIADFGGSWKFIIIFLGIMTVWITINVMMVATKAFDPYPFILLNLVLSCIASLQAPIIMMSNNRSEVRDRRRAVNDFKVNLKCEIEIRHLHEKMDHLITKQVQHLNEFQQIQIDLLEEINEKLKAK